ncbi:MAG: TraB/GumN family protein [Bacteroidetes bacterium]|nr:MAG: TraB/GumN family protein [Bacteroidota bacterium]
MKPSKKTTLWEIRREPGAQASFVFGTMHVRNLDVVRRQKAVLERVLACDLFACEIDLDEKNALADPSVLFLPDELRISDLLPRKKYEKLRRVFAKTTGVDLDLAGRYKPVFLAQLLTEHLLKKDMPYALDEFLWHFAKQNGRQLRGIETLNEQLAVLEKIDLRFQTRSLAGMGKNVGALRKHLLKMTRIYLEGDIQRLYKSSKKGLGKMRKMMIYDRNEIMAARIGTLAEEQSLFAAIGAGHLAGKKGVLRLLKKAGWKVRPVRF